MNDSRYLRLLACLQDAKEQLDAAEPEHVRALADELPETDPRVFLLRRAARLVANSSDGIEELLRKFAAFEKEGA